MHNSLNRTAAAITTLIMSITIMSCRNYEPCGVVGESLKLNCWISEDLFRGVSDARPDKNMKDTVKRRASSRKNAMAKTKNLIIDKFVETRMQSDHSGKSESSVRKEIINEFGELINSSTARSTTYDDEDNCEVNIEVKMANLKKPVEAPQK